MTRAKLYRKFGASPMFGKEGEDPIDKEIAKFKELFKAILLGQRADRSYTKRYRDGSSGSNRTCPARLTEAVTSRVAYNREKELDVR